MPADEIVMKLTMTENYARLLAIQLTCDPDCEPDATGAERLQVIRGLVNDILRDDATKSIQPEKTHVKAGRLTLDVDAFGHGACWLDGENMSNKVHRLQIDIQPGERVKVKAELRIIPEEADKPIKVVSEI